MANPWFRMYSEFAADPKVQVLTEALQRRYVMVLCLHCNGQYEKAPEDEIALALRITPEEWRETKETLIMRKLLRDDGSIGGWEKRQFISDIKDSTAAARQKRHREKKRNARNDTVTSRPPEADTDTDTEVNLSVTDVTDGKPSKVTDPDEIIFSYGVPLLTTAGTEEKHARSFLGGLRKTHGDQALVDALRECLRAKPLQPLEWMAAALPPRARGSPAGGKRPTRDSFENIDYGEGGKL